MALALSGKKAIAHTCTTHLTLVTYKICILCFISANRVAPMGPNSSVAGTTRKMAVALYVMGTLS